MPLYLIRHCHAGSRSGWAGADDYDRPLSDKGRGQALHIGRELASRPIVKLYSSPATRCVQSLEPLADKLGLEVTIAPELEEGADPTAAIAFLLAHRRQEAAFSSHGDLIPKVIRRLIAAGMRTSDANISTKGSWWELEVDDDHIVRGAFVPHARP